MAERTISGHPVYFFVWGFNNRSISHGEKKVVVNKNVNQFTLIPYEDDSRETDWTKYRINAPADSINNRTDAWYLCVYKPCRHHISHRDRRSRLKSRWQLSPLASLPRLEGNGNDIRRDLDRDSSKIKATPTNGNYIARYKTTHHVPPPSPLLLARIAARRPRVPLFATKRREESAVLPVRSRSLISRTNERVSAVPAISLATIGTIEGRLSYATPNNDEHKRCCTRTRNTAGSHMIFWRAGCYATSFNTAARLCVGPNRRERPSASDAVRIIADAARSLARRGRRLAPIGPFESSNVTERRTTVRNRPAQFISRAPFLAPSSRRLSRDANNVPIDVTFLSVLEI